MKLFCLVFLTLFSAGALASAETFKIKIVFSSACPCFTRSLPHLSELMRAYPPPRWSFEYYDVMSRDQAAAQTIAKAFKIQAPVYSDSKMEIAKQIGANVSPSVIVLQGSKQRYFGAIIENLNSESSIRKYPLKTALEGLDKGISFPDKTEPEGCYLSSEILSI